MTLETLLIPVDFSDRSIHALHHGAALAGLFGSKLLLVHVVPPSPYEYAAFDEGFYAAAWPDAAEVRERLTKRLDALAEKETAGRQVETVVVAGDPARQIQELATARRADLVVMPTHGYGLFRKLVLGSVASKVLHDVACPVFTGAHVPEIAPINQHPYRSVACAVDLEENSEKTLRWAADFAARCGADLTLLHAAPQVEVGGAYGDWFPADTREQVEASARERLLKLAQTVGAPLKAMLTESGRPAAVLSRLLSETKADLVVIGRSTHTGAFGDLLADAYAVIRHSPCPVISV
jgi:nucleotide-binding universal stress UspA family protein